MNPQTILRSASAQVGSTEGVDLARAALAVQNSPCGAGRKVDTMIAILEDRYLPETSNLQVDSIRSVVVHEIGINIERDDPLLLLLVATQDCGLQELLNVVEKHKRLERRLKFDLWRYRIFSYTLLTIIVIENLLIFNIYLGRHLTAQ